MTSRSWLLVTLLFLLVAGKGRAQEAGTDFESLSPELPGWSATLKGEDGQSAYRPAQKWDVPFSLNLDSEKPNSGGVSLRWDFSAEVPGMASLRVPFQPVPGPDVTIRFFVRTEGVGKDGLFSFEESETDGRRIKTHWAVAAIPQSDGWTEVRWTGTLGAATPGVRMSLVYTAIPAGAKIWIDDLSVTPSKPD